MRPYKILKAALLLLPLVAISGLTSCASVQPYQRQYLNDENMALSEYKLEVYETNFESYREGVAGANGGKTGGGCGCN